MAWAVSIVRVRSTNHDANHGSNDDPGPVGAVPPPDVPEIASVEYWNVVYDNPNPYSNLGVMLLWSKCL